jgi:hypothetical protein
METQELGFRGLELGVGTQESGLRTQETDGLRV